MACFAEKGGKPSTNTQNEAKAHINTLGRMEIDHNVGNYLTKTKYSVPLQKEKNKDILRNEYFLFGFPKGGQAKI